MPEPTIEVGTTFLEVAGKKTQLTAGGSGPPLLYLHSAGGETDWMPFHAALAERFRVYLPAHPGFDLSEGLDQIDGMADLVAHYVDLLDALELHTVPMVGFSLGGWLGVELAIHHPDRVQQLVIVDSAGLNLADAPMGDVFVEDLKQLRDLVFFDPDSPAVELAMPLSIEDDRILNWLRARKATAQIAGDPYLHNPQLPGQLQQVRCPTRILWGRQDRLIPVKHGEFYTSHIPGVQLTVFDECGHMLPFEKTDEFVAAVVEFVA